MIAPQKCPDCDGLIKIEWNRSLTGPSVTRFKCVGGYMTSGCGWERDSYEGWQNNE